MRWNSFASLAANITASIWVVNNSSNNVTKLNPSTGATIGTYPVGTSPIAVAFDGTSIWVANYGSSTVTKLDSTGATIGTFAVGFRPIGVAFDGTSIWVTHYYDNILSRILK